jgi:hypothetical protein
MAGQAAADVTQAYAGALDQNQRNMERMGVNPNSGRFAALTNEINLNKAKDTAGAMNKARNDTEMQGIALRTGAAQFGRNMPNTGIAAEYCNYCPSPSYTDPPRCSWTRDTIFSPRTTYKTHLTNEVF